MFHTIDIICGGILSNVNGIYVKFCPRIVLVQINLLQVVHASDIFSLQ